MTMAGWTEGQWPNDICAGFICYGRAHNYDGFYLADASHGIPTFGSVSPTDPVTLRGQSVHVFNYPGQTEEIAKQLVHRWNCHDAMLDALQLAADYIRDLDGGDPKTETGWKSEELLDVWQKARDAIVKATGHPSHVPEHRT